MTANGTNSDVADGGGRRRPFRFATGCYGPRTRAEYVDAVRRIEDLGYSTLLTPDHFHDDQLAAVAALTMAAATSSTLRIGTYVLANDFRHPAIVAKEAATLDVLSDGRFELGLGAGYDGSDYSRSGIALDPSGVRISRLAESVQVIKGLFGEGPFDYSGTFYTVTGLDGTPKPLQRPRPPLLLAGGRKRMLSLAGREADIVGLLQPTSVEGVDFSRGGLARTDEQVGWIRQAAGERFSSLELNTLVFTVVVTDHRREAAEELAVRLRTTPELVLNSVHHLVGTVDGIADDIRMWRERFGISYVAVMEEFRDSFAPVVARLAGT